MTVKNVSLRVAAAIVTLACAGIAAGQSSRLALETGPRVPAGPPINFGTTQESFVTIGAWEFDPLDSSQTFAIAGALNFVRYSTAGGAGFIGGVHLPDGSVLTSIAFDLCDSSVADDHWTAAITSCTRVDTVCAIVGAFFVSTSSVGNACATYSQDLSGLNYVVNNQTQRLALVAIPGADDQTNLLSGAVVGYKLQVSPAPANPTFGDVPTTHPFFQFVEALAKSGITSGCGGGNYCPDNPVTRGQMAVFLAKALGLQFP